ncbi:hypothetical protein [Streptomyces albus]|uniref:hypothetical protein n=1 Tax=Streptomyces albus TaxID=1888 RepID=UPI0033C73BA7
MNRSIFRVPVVARTLKGQARAGIVLISDDAVQQRVQLDGAGGHRGQKGPETLASSRSDKKRAVKFLTEQLLPDTQAAGRMGEGGGKVAPSFLGPQAPGVTALQPDTGLQGLSDWATAKAMSEALSVWEAQVLRLVSRLQGELQALRGTKNLLQERDIAQGREIAAAPESGLSDEGRRPLPSGLDHL